MTTSSASTVTRLNNIQATLLNIVRSAGPEDYARQFHDALSPLGWHLLHCMFIECLWLREVFGDDDAITASLRQQCLPQLAYKPSRGAQLPPFEALLDSVARMMDENGALLAALTDKRVQKGQFDSWEIGRFLVGHNAQHVETMRMVQTEMNLRRWESIKTSIGPHALLRATNETSETSRVPGGRYRIGAGGDTTETAFIYDNERPATIVKVASFEIAAKPVKNGAYLSFMEEGGYDTARWWSASGWAWRQRESAVAPHHWRRSSAGGWVGVNANGCHSLDAGSPVWGLSRHEAEAYARWAGGRLPHEYEWEIAATEGVVEDVGQVWEWCENVLHPYPGFFAFPYREYSVPWFDGCHFVLRGGSRFGIGGYNQNSFRNYYAASCRHMFAGVRLVA